MTWCPGDLTRKKNGFTVLEALIALSIIAVIITSTFMIFKGATNSWRHGEARAHVYQTVRSVCDIVIRDVSQAATAKGLGPVADAPLFSGTTDSMLFVTPMGDSRELIEVSYRLEEGRFNRRAAETIDGDPETCDYNEDLSDEIDEVQFAYLADGQWQVSWNSAVTKRLPQAVKMDIVLQKERFEIIIKIEAVN